jgi:hypothetical protein
MQPRCADACPICRVDLKRDGFPIHHQHGDTGELCPYDWTRGRSVPDIGDLFADDGRTYRVTGWLRRTSPVRPGSVSFMPDMVPMTFCTREQAEYVCGSGVGGVIRRLDDVTVIGRVNWSEEVLAQERCSFAVLLGKELF